MNLYYVKYEALDFKRECYIKASCMDEIKEKLEKTLCTKVKIISVEII